MTKFIIYCGLNDQNTKNQEISTIDAYKIASNIFVKTTGGATITEAVGVYTHDDGTIVTESTLRCEIFGADVATVESAAKALKTALNQESVVIEQVETNSKFF